MRFSSAVASVLVAVSLPACSPKPDPVTLRLQVAEGRSLKFTQEMDGTMSMNFMDKAMPETKYGFEAAFELVGGPVGAGGTQAVAMRHGRIHGTMPGMPGQVTAFDSDDPSTAARAPAALCAVAMAGSELQLDVDATGAVRDVHGVEAVAQRLRDCLADRDEFSELTSMFEEMFSNENFKRMTAQYFQQLPDRPVTVGDEWTTTHSAAFGPFGAGAVLTYEVVAIDATSLDYEVRGSIELDSDPSKVSGDPERAETMKLVLQSMQDMSTELHGRGRIWLADGLPVWSELTTSTNVETALPTKDAPTMKMHQSMVVRVRRVTS